MAQEITPIFWRVGGLFVYKRILSDLFMSLTLIAHLDDICIVLWWVKQCNS